MSSSSDGHRVGVDHSESLRVDGFLTLGGVNLLLVMVTVKVVLNLFVNNKAGFEVMNMLTIRSLVSHALVDVNLTA